MDPIAGTDVKRKKRREFSGFDSEDDYHYRLRRVYTSLIRHIEKLLPITSEKWLCDILIIIKKYYEHIVDSIDSILAIRLKINDLKNQNVDLDLEIIEHLKIVIYGATNPIVPLVKIITKDRNIVKSILNTPPKLEGLLPSITIQWLKDILLGIIVKLLGEKESS